MIQTLRLNFRDPDRRRYVGAKLGGKMIGVALVMAVIYGFAWFFSTQAGAAVPGTGRGGEGRPTSSTA